MKRSITHLENDLKGVSLRYGPKIKMIGDMDPEKNEEVELFLLSPYSKMVAILVFFCFIANSLFHIPHNTLCLLLPPPPPPQKNVNKPLFLNALGNTVFIRISAALD